MNAVVALLLFQAIAAVPAVPETRPLVLRVRDSSKVPVRGARIVVDGATSADRALAGTLARAAGVSKEDGLLDLGLVPATGPITLRIGATGFRAGTLKLPANFEPGRRDVVLVPNQDVEVRVGGLALRRGEARAEVSLARCRNQRAGSNCHPGDGALRPLDDEGRARFKRIEGGFYDAELHVPGLGATRQTVEVAADGDTPTLVVEMAVGEWTLRGTTRLHDGTPRPAHVKAMEFVNGIGEGTAAECTSAADGSFELKVISRAGNMIGLKAESDDPHAVANSTNPIKLDDVTRTVEDVVVELDATTLVVTVLDARSGEPLKGCMVQVDWEKDGEASHRGSQLTTDEKGVAREYALAGGTVRANVTCKGHYSKDLGTVSVARDQVKQIETSLDPSKEIVLAAVDDGGRPVEGAGAFVLTGPLASYMGVGMAGTVARAGATDEAGEMRLAGEAYGGHPIFLVAPGRAIAMALVPSPASCDRPEDCRLVVTVRRPSAFAGLTLRNESGKPIALPYVTFLLDGIPVPNQVLAAALAVNGIAPEADAMPIVVRRAAFLPPGRYTVSTPHAAVDSGTKKEVWTAAVVGFFFVPSFEPVELVDRDGVSTKPGDAVAPRVAER